MSIPNNGSKTHDCGGTILSSSNAGLDYYYCDDCGAFVFEDDPQYPEVPSGTDEEKNHSSWDDGATRSPSGDYTEDRDAHLPDDMDKVRDNI